MITNNRNGKFSLCLEELEEDEIMKDLLVKMLEPNIEYRLSAF